ncbi:MAG: hypothetical protein HYS62_02940 [Candidatus Aenigmarchaeota archaeon]|nr:hypothetical protein [Candidatus Aenigmarchaeota archaeon]
MPDKKGILITFTIKSQKFKPSEKTFFFRKLYGWKQVVPNENKVYEYERPGILDEIPHEKVDQSSFLVPENHADELMDFFDEWHNKIMLKTFKVLLDRETESIFDEFEKEFEEDE